VGSHSAVALLVPGVLIEEVADALAPDATAMRGASAPTSPFTDELTLLSEYELISTTVLCRELEELLHGLNRTGRTGPWCTILVQHRVHTTHCHGCQNADLLSIWATLGNGPPALDLRLLSSEAPLGIS
jgi:hypothetical protein